MAWSEIHRDAFELLFRLGYVQRMTERADHQRWRWAGEHVDRAGKVACQGRVGNTGTAAFPLTCHQLEELDKRKANPDSATTTVSNVEIHAIAQTALAEIPVPVHLVAARAGHMLGYALGACELNATGSKLDRGEVLKHIQVGFQNLDAAGEQNDALEMQITEMFNRSAVDFAAVARTLKDIAGRYGRTS